MDKRTDHLKGLHKQDNSAHTWPDEFYKNLPQHFAEYRAVLWDNEKAAIIIIPKAKFNDRLPYIAVTSGIHKRLDFIAPQIASLGARPKSEFGYKNKFRAADGTLQDKFTILLGNWRTDLESS